MKLARRSLFQGIAGVLLARLDPAPEVKAAVALAAAAADAVVYLCRIRFNEITQNIEASISGGPYLPLGCGPVTGYATTGE